MKLTPREAKLVRELTILSNPWICPTGRRNKNKSKHWIDGKKYVSTIRQINTPWLTLAIYRFQRKRKRQGALHNFLLKIWPRYRQVNGETSRRWNERHSRPPIRSGVDRYECHPSRIQDGYHYAESAMIQLMVTAKEKKPKSERKRKSRNK